MIRALRIGGGIAILLALFGFVVRLYVTSLSTPLTHPPVHFVIERGEGVHSITRRLSESNIIAHPFVFETYLIVRGYARKLKTGAYDFAFPLTGFQVADTLVAGKPNERSVRILEGWTIRDIQEYFERENIMSAAEFRSSMARIDRTQYPFLDQHGDSLEGYFFPDTYRIYTDERRSEIFTKMLDTYQKRSAPLLSDAKHDLLSSHEHLVLASILEREVRASEDRRRVADIFYRRLSVGMPLQADSTVNYITGAHTPAVSATDLAIESPYNTYRHTGLPPTPICSPSVDAIQSALHPDANRYWYFLTTTEGKVIYSVTYEEHLKNKRIHILGTQK